MIKRAKEIGASSQAITDHGNLGNTIAYLKGCKDNEVKPLLGCEIYVSEKHASERVPDNRSLSHLLVYAKNNKGWKQLLKLVSESNRPDYFYYRPRLGLEQLKDFADGNLICVNGHLGSVLGDVALNNDYSDCKELVKWFKDCFGIENFFLEAQPICNGFSEENRKLINIIRKLGKETDTKVVATPDAHYCRKEDAILQRIVLCKSLNIRLEDGKDCGMSTFFKHDVFHIPTYQEMLDYGSTEEELARTLEFADLFEEYTDILHDPILPKFECPDGHTDVSWLRQLCREGWKQKIGGKVDKSKEKEYADRIKYELEVFENANLSSYFLIVKDILDFVKNKGWMTGVGRGSASGCLTSFLLDITQVDPIKYDLMFERFYSAGRAKKKELPDIDFDVPQFARSHVLHYVKEKYGQDNVGQIITFGTLQGRSALKEVLRAKGVPFDLSNKISQGLPEAAKISGELQEMKEERGDSSLIQYALEHQVDKFKEWCYINKEGNLDGPYAQEFDLAIRLEGTIVSSGKHAAGIVVFPSELSDICPLVYDKKSRSRICGFSLDDIESVGGMKLDSLGLKTLSKMMGVKSIVETGKLVKNEEYKES